MDRDEIMHLVNETAPRYMSWGCEAHFQLFAKRLMEIEREACAQVCDKIERRKWEAVMNGGAMQGIGARDCAAAIRARGEQ